ncbi:hypothetical protein F5X99DRAFT_368391 [Biscogniauxia marginata]|nr:hypothetical protein F5X99DRAFT_368391 [Biscogniauxia marginata]
MLRRKSVLCALCAGNGAIGTAAGRTAAAGLQRSFTSTAPRNVHITKFTPASSPELDELLNTIRTKIILPSYLPQNQRKKIASKKYEKTLQADPIIMEIDGEVFKFRHLDNTTDIPSTRHSVIQAISQFNAPQDFSNLVPLFEGIANTGYKFDEGFYCKIIRIMGIRGHITSIIECARRVKTTNFRLDTSEKVNNILHYVQMMAIESEPERREIQIRKSLRWAELVIEMVQEEDHEPRLTKDEVLVAGELPLDRDPMVLLAPLHLAALLAKYETAESELRDKIVDYAEDIVSLWPEQKKLRQVQPGELYGEEGPLAYLMENNKFVIIATPLLHGLDSAIEYVEPALAEKLRSRRNILAGEIQEAMETHKARLSAADREKPILGEVIYGKFYGDESARGEDVYKKSYIL